MMMAEPDLQGLRILVVEDEYLIADDLRDALLEASAIVLGPVPTVDAAKELIGREPMIDAALLDINLG
jgi:DNA-binding response OmpR family regulator